MKTNLLLLVATCLTVTACGKITSSMDAVSSMNGKMDATNNGMSSMNGKMDITNKGMNETNEHMKSMLAAMGETNGKMDITNGSMSKTNKAIHNQTLGVALDMMIKPDNTKYVTLDSTVPTSMMVPGKIFAEEATQEEIALLVTMNVLEINTAQPDSKLMDAVKGDFPDAVKNSDDTDKWVKFMVSQIVAGLAPQATIEDMVKTQITNAGFLEAAAYQTLSMRHFFISNYILDNNLLAQKLDAPGMFEEALRYISELKYIEELPFKANIKVELTGFFDVSKRGLNKTWTLGDSDVKKDYYAKLKADLTQLAPRYKNPTTPEDQKRMDAIKKQIDDGIAGTATVTATVQP